ncbi:MAG: SGNH/GDSL hydrolase family protein [Acidobacteriota bacterium]
MRRTRKAVFILVGLFAAGLISLLLAEGFLRLFPGFLPPERRQYMLVDLGNVGVKHPYIGHLHTPNARKRLSGPDYDVRLTTGAFGFRNPGPWPRRADLVVLGDSLVFGYGVPDQSAWPAILDRSFPNLKVVNLGLVGAGAEQYLRVYRTFGEPLRPKLVIVGMFPGNDFWDAREFNEWLEEGAKGNYMAWRNYGHYSGTWKEQPVEAVKSFALRHSYLYNLVIAARSSQKTRRAGEPKILRMKDGQEIRLLPSDFRSKTAGSRAGRPELGLTVEALAELRDRVHRSGGQILVVLQPSKEEVYLPMLGEKVRDPSAELRPALRKLGIEYLDLAPAFKREAKAGRTLFFGSDGHPNSEGYRLIAGEVTRYLATLLGSAAFRSVLGLPIRPRLRPATWSAARGDRSHSASRGRRGGAQ